MRALFFNPNYDTKALNFQRMTGFPMGIVSIATYLNRHGHTANVIDRTFCGEPLEALWERYAPDVVGISLVSNLTIPDMIRVSDFFRGKNVPVVLGGTYASMIPDIILNEGKADLVTVGEGEQIWLNIMDTLARGGDPRALNGVVYRKEDGEIVEMPPEPLLDLALLGPADFSLLPNVSDYFQPVYRYDNMVYLYLSKGCPSNCTFCFNEFFHRCRRRVRPVDHLLDEVEFLINNHGLETVYFADELWGAKKSERDEFYEKKKARGLSFIWGCQTRIGVLKQADIEEMYENGCRWILFGIETPPGHLAEIANKKLPFDLVAPTLEWCRSAGMISSVSFILNYPHETVQDLKDTVSYMQALPTTYYNVNLYSPFEKSALFDVVVKEGLYDPPKTLEALSQNAMIETLYSSFSEVPDRDYRVIRAGFMVEDLFARFPNVKKEKSASFIFEAIKTVLLNIRTLQFREWVLGVFYSGRYFLVTMGNVIFFPRTRKKYGFKFRFKR